VPALLYVPTAGRRAAVAAGLLSVLIFPAAALALLRGAGPRQGVHEHPATGEHRARSR
jgi:hypothetical protein